MVWSLGAEGLGSTRACGYGWLKASGGHSVATPSTVTEALFPGTLRHASRALGQFESTSFPSSSLGQATRSDREQGGSVATRGARGCDLRRAEGIEAVRVYCCPQTSHVDRAGTHRPGGAGST